MKKMKNQRGIAYLIVISFVMIMMTMVVALKERTVLNHQIALNARARLQSYYLAKSGFSLSKLLLLYNKKIQSQIQKSGVSSSTIGKMGFQPLYKMFPLSSALLRGVADLAGTAGGERAAQEASNQDGEESETDGGIGKSVGFLQQEKFKEFLDFNGDFDVEIDEEQSRYSLNAISKMTSTSSSYDLHKKILLGLLSRKVFENFFENQDRDAESLVHALSDYVDANDAVNEFDQAERGREDAEYKGVEFHPKNGKFLSLSEIRLVPGMSDDIFFNLEPLVSVYQSNDKLNACLGEEDLLDTLIVHYTTESGCVNPIDPDDEDLIKELRDEVLLACPDVSAMANALNVKLGVKSEQEVTAAEQSGTAESQQTSAQVSGCKVQFKDLITDANDVFTVSASGTIDEVRTTLKFVLETSSSSASAWKTLYYQVR